MASESTSDLLTDALVLAETSSILQEQAAESEPAPLAAVEGAAAGRGPLALEGAGRPPLLVRAATGLGNLLANTTLLGLGSAVGSQVTLRIHAHRQPHPLPHQMAALLDHPLRLRYRNPGDTLGLFGLGAGMTVLDLGCGTGLFTEEAARMVGPTGRVHAVDIQAPMLAAARTRVAAAGFGERVHFHHAGAYALPLENLSADVALLIAVLGEVPDRLHALLEVYRVLKPGGRLAVGEEPAHPAYMGGRTLRALAAQAGFVFVAQTGGPLAYNAVFERPAA